MPHVRAWFSIAAVCVTVGCGSGSSVLTPRVAIGTAAPGTKASDKPSPTPTSSITAASAEATVVRVNSAEKDVSGFFATLPHVSATSDINALAAHMASSPLYKAAQVSGGGISAMLEDGTPVFVPLDHLAEEYAAKSSALTGNERAGARSFIVPRRADSTQTGPPTAAFLVNMREEQNAGEPVAYEFNPERQAQFVQSFQDAGIAAVEADTSLEQIIALGQQTSGLDFLAIDTHGGELKYAYGIKLTTPSYLWISTDLVTFDGIADTWKNDIDLGNVGYSLDAYDLAADPAGNNEDGTPSAHFYFTAGFLVSHLHFNPGAIVDNGSCDGAANDEPANALAKANVGRYYGWTGVVLFNDADQTDAFLVDRLTGEINSNLSQYVSQRDPLQRPFPLDAIQAALYNEQRSGPLSGSHGTYAESISGTTLVVDDFGGEELENPPVEFGLPSIERMKVDESPTGGTLTILGHFPAKVGFVTISDPTVGASKDFDATSWTTSTITVSIPASGAYSKGDVQVTTDTGVVSNTAPLTQWSGTLESTQNETIRNVGSNPGHGAGTIVIDYTVDFRADIHPVVPSIDTSPVPQNLTFGQPEADSTAVISQLSGTFASGDGTATYGIAESQAPMTPVAPPLEAGNFGLAAVTGQPSSCNNAQPGPQSGPTNVFCPEIGYTASSIGTCKDDNTGICTGPTWAPEGIFGSPQIANDGLLELTMDPSAYTISVSSTEASGRDTNFEADASSVTGSVTGTFGAPVDPPGSSETQRSTRVRRLPL